MNNMPNWYPTWSSLGAWVVDGGTVELEMHDGGIWYEAADDGAAGVELSACVPLRRAIVRLAGAPFAQVSIRMEDARGSSILEARRVLDRNGITSLKVPGPMEADAADGEARRIRILVSSTDRNLFLRHAELCVLPDLDIPRRTLYADPVCVGIATIPSRTGMLEDVVERLLPQVDHLFVYLNGYVSCPQFLKREGVTVFRSQDFGDYRDNSKFFGLYLIADSAYYLSADDDIEYPPNHIASIVAGVDRYDRKAVVGLHGVVYGSGSRHFRDRITFHFEEELEQDMPVNVLGTGTVGFHTSAFRPDCLSFDRTGMADLVIGQALSAMDVPAIVLGRPAKMLEGMKHPPSAITLFDETKAAESPHDIFIRSHSWRLVAAGVPAVVDKLGPVACVFLAYETALRGGISPHHVAVPWLPGIRGLAEYHHLRGFAVASVRGRLAGLVRRALAGHPEQGEGGAGAGSVQAECLSFLRRFLSSIVEVDVPGLDTGGQASDAPGDTDWLEPAVAAGDTELVCVHACLDMLESGTPAQLHALCQAAGRAYEMELAETAATEIERTGRFQADDVVELSVARLKSGSQQRVVQDAAELIESGRPGQLLLAMAALSCGHGWAQDVAEEALRASKPRGSVLRRMQDLTGVLRGVGRNVIDVRRFSEQMSAVPEVLILDVASVLLSASYWRDDFDLERLPLPPGVERDLWLARIRQVKDPDGQHALHAINRAFLRQGMLPVDLAGSAGAFFDRLSPVAGRRSHADGPLVTVIIAAFNAENTIRYALRSVLDQSYRNVEVVVVDDASQQPLDIGWASGSDIPVSLVRLEENAGPYVCRNVALSRANGELIATHDADDWMHPQKIERQVAAIQRHGVVAAYSRHLRLDDRGVLAFENNGRFIGDGPITSMFWKSVVNRLGGFRDVRTRGDVEFKARMSSSYGRSAVLQQDDLTLLALDSATSNSKRALKTWRDELALARFKLRYALEHPLRILCPHSGLPGVKNNQPEKVRSSPTYPGT